MKKNFVKKIFNITLFLIAVFILFQVLLPQLRSIPQEIKLERVKVIEKNESCAIDLICYIKLENSMWFLYGKGLGPADGNDEYRNCKMPDVSNVVEEDYLEVFGKLHSDNEIRFCADKYYVRRLSE